MGETCVFFWQFDYLFFLSSPMLQVTGKHGCNEVILTRFSNIIFVIPTSSHRGNSEMLHTAYPSIRSVSVEKTSIFYSFCVSFV